MVKVNPKVTTTTPTTNDVNLDLLRVRGNFEMYAMVPNKYFLCECHGPVFMRLPLSSVVPLAVATFIITGAGSPESRDRQLARCRSPYVARAD